MSEINDKTIYDFCDSRWQFYINRDGAYYPSKHDNTVLGEAAKEFNITQEEALAAFDRVAKLIANREVKGMSKSEMADALKTIVEGNAETPWGYQKLKEKNNNLK